MFAREAHLIARDCRCMSAAASWSTAAPRRPTLTPLSTPPPSASPSSCGATSGACATITPRRKKPRAARQYVLAPVEEEAEDDDAAARRRRTAPPGGDRRDEHRTAAPDGRRGGHAHGPGGRAGAAVPQPLAWRAQPRLSARRRQYRLDRSRIDPRREAAARCLTPASAMSEPSFHRRYMRRAGRTGSLDGDRRSADPERVIAQLRVSNKKQALAGARPARRDDDRHRRAPIYEALAERERLGTTGIGNGDRASRTASCRSLPACLACSRGSSGRSRSRRSTISRST